jgi:hypothetical protein
MQFSSDSATYKHWEVEARPTNSASRPRRSGNATPKTEKLISAPTTRCIIPVHQQLRPDILGARCIFCHPALLGFPLAAWKSVVNGSADYRLNQEPSAVWMSAWRPMLSGYVIYFLLLSVWLSVCAMWVLSTVLHNEQFGEKFRDSREAIQ